MSRSGADGNAFSHGDLVLHVQLETTFAYMHFNLFTIEE